MIGIVVQLIISWVLLHFLEHKNLGALGLYPTKRRIKDFLTVFFLTIVYTCALLFGIAALVHNPYQINPGYTLPAFLKSSAYVLRAVVYEELIFRGALLYLLIRHIGVAKATLLSAASFGIYHWFSWGLLGQPIPMLIAFVSTGLAGYLWALLYVKTRSMYLPAALHVGNNFASMILFSKDSGIGLQLLIKTHAKDPVVPPAYISIPMIIIYYIGFYLLCYAIFRCSKPQPVN